MRLPILMSLALLSTGCAYNQKPVVDLDGVDPVQYEQDYAACERYAESVDKGEAARVGATNAGAAGAAGGAVVGAIEDGASGALIGAVAGGIGGAAMGASAGAGEATRTQALVLRRCLSERGYVVYDLER
ncbi:glycine zipper family protein [Ferrimonas balearica]|uniref:glycine zipper family protein n=1 Tax=Ferrimonas balearica TaxID=44012 RepID=UPI001C994A5B|nr:glycine zipper family protein [Ferrimonas balearica]MBY5993008.1 glycine zipper family protein [Ferrimonas balearica]